MYDECMYVCMAGVDALVGEPTPPTSSASSAVDLTYHTVPLAYSGFLYFMYVCMYVLLFF